MTSRRFHLAALPPEGGIVVLDDESRQHLRVLRLAAGAEVELFDGAGHLADAVLLEGGRCRAEPAVSMPRVTPQLSLVLAMPKGKKLDACVRSATELGVAHMWLASSERSQQLGTLKLDRLERVVREAARQSEQVYAPIVHAPRPLLEAAAQVSDTARRLGCFARDDAAAPRGPVDEVVVAVGPEGGFSPAEIDALVALGYRSHPLGPGILRVETAVPVGLALARAGAH